MKDLRAEWKEDEQAVFTGWDFSYLRNRYREEKPPWDYRTIAKELIKQANAVLDMGTGGGEILSSLGPFPEHTVATEGWPPNVPIARRKLEPLGIKVVAVDESEKSPFTSGEFDLVLNRHGAFDEREVFRVLQDEGVFLTQQVSSDNLRDLIQEFNVESQLKDWRLKTARNRLGEVGFKIKEANEWAGKAEFKDIGALVYFLRAIPWIIDGFSVDNYFPTLQRLQERIDSGNKLIFTETRFLIRARK